MTPAKALATQDRGSREQLVKDLVDYLVEIPVDKRMDALHAQLDRYVDLRRTRSPDVDEETLSDERDILLGRVVYAVAVWQLRADGAGWRHRGAATSSTSSAGLRAMPEALAPLCNFAALRANLRCRSLRLSAQRLTLPLRLRHLILQVIDK
jgi:hypothetical protein